MALPSPLMNRERGQTVLDERGVSALVLGDPVNVLHATGFWPQTVAMGQAGVSFAVVPLDARLPVYLVTSQFMHYLYDIDDPAGEGPLRILLYTSPAGLDGEDTAPPIFFGHAADGTPDPYEGLTRDSTERLMQAHPPFPDVKRALRTALDTLGCKGLIATDSGIPESFFGAEFKYTQADPLVRLIRMIKTQREIARIRFAARNNAEAARHAVTSVGVGESYDAVRCAFFAETGRRGGVPLFISTDNTSRRQRGAVIEAGRSYSIDAVSKYDHYYGDYGRPVFVGEPAAPVRRALDAAIAANDAVAAELRPGLRYSDITRIGKEAVSKAGYDVMVACGAHSLGLYHTDEGFRDDSLHFAKADHLIEENMVLSVDCPTLQSDIAGGVHLEDLWLITADGCEPLNERTETFIQI